MTLKEEVEIKFQNYLNTKAKYKMGMATKAQLVKTRWEYMNAFYRRLPAGVKRHV